MRTRNGRRKVPFGTNYPMIFHDPTLADLDALAFADEARELYLSANAQRLFEEGPRRLLCLGERERAGRRVWCPQRTRLATTARSPKRSCLGPAERKHRRAGSSEQQILLLARGEAGASTRDRDAIGSRFEQKAARTRSRLRLLPVVAHARDRALADRASVSALMDRCCFHRRSGVLDPAALARIAGRACQGSRLQPVKHEPHGSGATLSLAFQPDSAPRFV